MTPAPHGLVFGSDQQLVSIALLPKFLLDPENVNVEPAPIARTDETANDCVRRIAQQEREPIVALVTGTRTVEGDEPVVNGFKVTRVGASRRR